MELWDTNEINFEQFLKTIIKEKLKKEKDNEADNLNAFIALGGNTDKSGLIKVSTII